MHLVPRVLVSHQPLHKLIQLFFLVLDRAIADVQVVERNLCLVVGVRALRFVFIVHLGCRFLRFGEVFFEFGGDADLDIMVKLIDFEADDCQVQPLVVEDVLACLGVKAISHDLNNCWVQVLSRVVSRIGLLESVRNV